MVPNSQETQARKSAALAQAMGPKLAELLGERRVTDILVNPDGKIWVERFGEGRTFSGDHLSPADAERVMRLVADHVGEVVTRDQPLLSAVLPGGGERFQGVYMPVAERSSFAIRKPPSQIFTLEEYVEAGVMTTQQAIALEEAAEARENILIAGGTGAGKTTLANAVLNLEAITSDRVVLIEDTPELQCAALDKLSMLTKRTKPTVTMTDLVRASLRLRPDRIVIGEVRDGSALDLLKAWNTGHPGGLATLHANSAREALVRLEDLIAEVAQTVPYRAIGQAIGLIAFMRRAPGGRLLEEIVRVEGWSDGVYRTTTVT